MPKCRVNQFCESFPEGMGADFGWCSHNPRCPKSALDPPPARRLAEARPWSAALKLESICGSVRKGIDVVLKGVRRLRMKRHIEASPLVLHTRESDSHAVPNVFGHLHICDPQTQHQGEPQTSPDSQDDQRPFSAPNSGG